MENPKIGIVTIVYAENYGAVLQCYALKQILLKKYGDNISVLDYYSEADKVGYGILYNTLLKKHLWISYAKYLFKLPFVYHKKVKRKSIFENFRNTYLEPRNAKKLDVIVYGSDQIWAYAPDFGGYNSVYWGEGYEGTRKIAYSASMGIITDVDNHFITKHICKFDSISVRENELHDFLEKFYSKPINVTLDPTLLLDFNYWSIFAGGTNIFNCDYILVYNLNGNEVIRKAAQYLSQKTNLKIVEILGCPQVNENFYSRSTFTPNEFVTLFKFASYVLTSSFHGTVFSMIFKKDFWVSQKYNTKRVMSLLTAFGYQGRFIDQEVISEVDHIDYSTFDTKLGSIKKQSEDYLFNSIENEKKS